MGGGALGVPLPEGHIVAARGGAGGPVCWVSDGAVPARLWGRLRAAHGRSGLWPVLVFDGLGELAFGWFATDAAAVDRLDAAAVLTRSWEGFAVGFLTRPDRRALGLTTRWWQDWRRLPAPWPGSAPAGTRVADPDRLADLTAARLVAAVTGRVTKGSEEQDFTDDADEQDFTDDADEQGFTGGAVAQDLADGVEQHGVIDAAGDLVAAANVGPGVQLALVPCARGADALAVGGWVPSDGEPGLPEALAAVVRSWEDRYGARLVGVGGGTLLLSVAAPPVTLRDAVRVAVEHFGFCPEAEPAGGFAADPDGAQFLQYATHLVGRRLWRFWWD